MARTRTRGDAEIETGFATPAGRVTGTGRLLFQAGPEGKSAGRLVSVGSAWSPPPLPGGIRLRAAIVAERSRAGVDTLRSLFDYDRVEPSVELRRPLGWTGEISLRTGLGRKTTPREAMGAYHERWAEAGWSVWGASRHRFDLRARAESRTYARRAALLPSYDQWTVEADAVMPLSTRLQLRLSPNVARVAYASDDSLVFRDHWAAESVLRAERLFGGGRADTLGFEPGLEAEWRAFSGVRVGRLRNERVRDADYHLASFLVGAAREAIGAWWVDLSAEVGRRDYRGSGAGGTLVFEGYNLSVAGTDYTFVSSSLLGQASLGRGLRLEVFVLWDREIHREEADDVSLWAGSASVSRGF